MAKYFKIIYPSGHTDHEQILLWHSYAKMKPCSLICLKKFVWLFKSIRLHNLSVLYILRGKKSLLDQLVDALRSP